MSEQTPETEALDQVKRRATRRRVDGVKYKLCVIPGSGGQLELVEEPPPRNWFHECARAMSITGMGF